MILKQQKLFLERKILMSKIYCFDIDETICVTNGTDYEKAEPINSRINQINSLKEAGNKIIFYTARGFVTKIDYRKVTEKQLFEWGVQYDELYMNKPNADVYIDDKNKDPFDWFS